MAVSLDVIVIAVYLVLMIAIGWYAKGRAKTESDFLVAGRRLGPALYAGTLGAMIMGGGSTVGGVALGYQYGISGMWLVFNIAFGVLLLSLLFAARINRLKVYTVSQMLELRYGPGASIISGGVMLAYTLLIAITSTIAYGSIFSVLFDVSNVSAILLGGGVMVLYSVFGGMWSITLTDFMQFVIKTIGWFFILLPFAIIHAGGFSGMQSALPETAFDLTHIGIGNIFTFFVLYAFTMIIGQDLWQRVFTARSDKVAKWAGAAAATYGICYGIAGALIGMSAKVLIPGITNRDDVYTEIVRFVLPDGVAGFVVAGALAAIMSTSSGALIASATVAKEDIFRNIRRRTAGPEKSSIDEGPVPVAQSAAQEHDEVRSGRWFILIFGAIMIGVACILQDVVASLTLASAVLVGGLLVAIIGGLVWQRGTLKGALTSIITGTVLTLGTMAAIGDIYANTPIFVGLAGSLISYIVVSLLDKPTPSATLERWNSRANPAPDSGSLDAAPQEPPQPVYRTNG